MDKMPDRNLFVPLRFDSSTLPTDQQYEIFASAMTNFDMSRPGSGGFRARSLVWRIGALVVTQVSSDPVCYDRPLARVRADRTDHYYVNYYTRGRLTFDGGQGIRRVGPGSLLVIDMRQPCSLLDHGPKENISLAIPRRMLLERMGDIDPHGLVVRGGMASLLGPILRTVCTTVCRLEEAQGAVIEQMIVNLVAATLLEAASGAKAASVRQDAVFSRVRAHIDLNLSEPLDVRSICQALGISRSSLYRAFEGGGGVVREIQRRRLNRMRVLLLDPQETRPIASLAAATGFCDKSHFTRVFKKAFGVTPSAFRTPPAKSPEPATASDEHSPRQFGTWVREVG
ncbi:helix-turn-helix domain-containing protein [Sphingomonas koreensis]|nr:helix-turn-helix domain-containing protein [Sphingomonas koreensis]